MQRFLYFTFTFAIAASTQAGLTYKIQSVSRGVQTGNLSGTVSVDGPRMRFDVATGDGMIFKENSIVLSSDGGRTMSVFDPATRNYFDLQLEQLVSSSTAMLNSAGGMVHIEFKNPRVSVRDGGDGGTIEGYPTHKYTLDAAYDLDVNVMGQKMNMHTTVVSENWTTEQLSSEYTSFLQLRGMRTGIEAVDQMVEAQRNGIRGFPLKQETTVQIQGIADMTIVTTSSVSAIRRGDVEAAQFAAPSGYTKVDDPVTRMVKQMGQ